MDEAVVRMQAEMWALIVEAQAIMTEVEGMKAANQFSGDGSHYPEAAFTSAAAGLHEIAEKLKSNI